MGQDLASVAFHDQTSAALSAKICILFMATARPCTCAHTLMHPIQMILTLHTALTATVVLLCLRNGIFDAQVTNRRGRVELQRAVVARNTHLQQCLADFCSLELVHGVHCPRWASLIVYMDGTMLHGSVAQNKQSSCSSLIWLLCCMLLHVPADWLHAVALLKGQHK